MKIVSSYVPSISEEIEKDFEIASQFDKLRIGVEGVYIPAGFKSKFIPYDCFNCCYVKVHETKARMCCATAGFEYYRIVFMKDETCIADYISEDKEAMKAALDKLRTCAPGIKIGLEN